MTLILSTILALIIISGEPKPNLKDPLVITRYGEVLLDDLSNKEREDVYFVRNNCPGVPASKIDPFDVLVLLRLEKEYGIPPELKGILPAIFCIESNLQKGYKLYGDGGLALGPGQLHKGAYASCIATTKDNLPQYDFRNDFIFSARCWVANIERVNKKVYKLCPTLDKKNTWTVSEAFVSAYGRYKNKGCKAKSKHTFLLEKWQKKGFNK